MKGWITEGWKNKWLRWKAKGADSAMERNNMHEGDNITYEEWKIWGENEAQKVK